MYRPRSLLIQFSWMCLALFICGIQAFAQDQVASETWHVRLVWGGGKARAYRGSIQLEQGKFKQVQSLGVKSSSVLDVVEETSTQLIVDTDAASQFVGVDLEIQGSPSTVLHVSFAKNGSTGKEFEQSCRLSDLETERKHWNIDETQNRLFIDRVPGDRLRVASQYSHLIFRPHERMDLQVHPFRTGLPEGSSSLKVQLVREEDQSIIFEESHNIQIDSKGSASPLPIGIEIPDREGVYHWQFLLEPRRRLGGLLSSKPWAQRSVQWVVMGSTHTDGTSESDELETKEWQTTQTLDLFASPINTVRPLLRRLGGAEEYPAASSSPIETRQVGDVSVLVIPTEAWRSLPMESLPIGMPHQLVVRVPCDRPMQCAIVVLEPNAAGQLEVASPEGGVQVTEVSEGFAEYRLAFWPKTSNPQLLFYNPSGEQVASIAQVDILSGPSTLSSLTEAEKRQRAKEPRLIAMQLEGTEWFKQFGIDAPFDDESNRALADWNTYYAACQRLAEYCDWAGFNAVVVSGMNDGGMLYPSKSIRGNARLDQGMYFSDGRDPIRKDVLELMMQYFDREGLRLIVDWHFNAPLAELERLRTTGTSTPRPIDQCMPDGTPWHLSESNRAYSRRYHPLHPEYQRLVASHCSELLQRYGKHPSWAGISLHLSPVSHHVFAGGQWAWDNLSLNEFAKSMSIRIPEDVPSRQDTLGGPMRSAWWQWRADMLNQSWDRLQRQLTQSEPPRQLFLDSSSLLETPKPSSLANGLANQDATPIEVLNSHGVGVGDASRQPTYTWLRNDTEQRLLPIVERRWQALATASNDLDQLARSLPRSGASLKQTHLGFPLVGLSQPKTAEGTSEPIWIYPQLSEYGPAERQRLLKRWHVDDGLVFIASGSVLLNPADASLKRTLRTIANLPAEKMATIPMGTQGDAGNNVQFRMSMTPEGICFSLINNAPWHERVECEWSTTHNGPVEWISEPPSGFGSATQQGARNDLVSGGLPRTIKLKPFQLLAWRVPGNATQVRSWNHRAIEDVRSTLVKSLEQLAIYLNRTAQQHSSYPMENEDFEAKPGVGNPVPGWKTSILPSTTVVIDNQVAHAGAQSLRMEHQGKQGAAWILSQPIKPPVTGRLALECYVRSSPSRAAPQLEVNISCRRKDGSKYTQTYPLAIVDHEEQRFVDPTGVAAPRARWVYCTVPLLKDTPPDTLAEVQFSIDLKSQGTVWIDDLRLNDLFLEDDERRSLRADLFMSTRELDRGNYAMAQRLLDSYWAEYLEHFAWDEPEQADRDRVVDGGGYRKIMTSTPNPIGSREPGEGSIKSPRERDRPWLKRVREGLFRGK